MFWPKLNMPRTISIYESISVSIGRKKQLLVEVEHDIKIYPDLGQSYLPKRKYNYKTFRTST